MAIFYTPIDNVSSTLTTAYSIGGTGLNVANGSLWGSPTVAQPTLVTVVNGNEQAGTATYMIREVIGVNGNALHLSSGVFIDGTIDQNIAAGSTAERRITARDFTDMQTAINAAGGNNAASLTGVAPSSILPYTGVTPGTYPLAKVTVDAAGRITVISNTLVGSSGSVPYFDGVGNLTQNNPGFTFDPNNGLMRNVNNTASTGILVDVPSNTINAFIYRCNGQKSFSFGDFGGSPALNIFNTANGTLGGYIQYFGSLLQFGTYVASDIDFVTNNVSRWTIKANGLFGNYLDNNWDIGTLGNNRPRSVYVGTMTNTQGLGMNVVVATGVYYAQNTDFMILGSGACTINLPPASVYNYYSIKKIDSGAGLVSVTASGTNLIEGSSTVYQLGTINQYINLAPDHNTNWWSWGRN